MARRPPTSHGRGQCFCETLSPRSPPQTIGQRVEISQPGGQLKAQLVRSDAVRRYLLMLLRAHYKPTPPGLGWGSRGFATEPVRGTGGLSQDVGTRSCSRLGGPLWIAAQRESTKVIRVRSSALAACVINTDSGVSSPRLARTPCTCYPQWALAPCITCEEQNIFVRKASDHKSLGQVEKKPAGSILIC